MKVFFRVDSSTQIGSGHIVRCITLARELRSQGATCVFLCKKLDGNLFDLVIKNSFELRKLDKSDKIEISKNNKVNLYHSLWLESTQLDDAKKSITLINNEYPDWIIVDHYGLDTTWQKILRPHCKKILVIDDLADRKHDCDLLLDQNLVEKYHQRYDHLLKKSTIKLLGPKYALLQDIYSSLRKLTTPKENQINNILVYFGVSDLFNLTEIILDIFLELPCNIKVDFVVSSSHNNLSTIKKKVSSSNNFHLHIDLPTLAPILQFTDVAIGAGGTTIWERCSLGVPSYVITVADNQKSISSKMHEQGYIQWLGHYNQIKIETLKKVINDLVGNKVSISKWSKHCFNLVDGLGAKRVVELIYFDKFSDLQIRDASNADEEILLAWRNELGVRANSLQNFKIRKKEHKNWFEMILEQPEKHSLYIISTVLGFSIGQVRFSLSDLGWELHYSIRSEFRGRGLAKKMLLLAINTFSTSRQTDYLIAQVKIQNFISVRVLTSLGFEKYQQDNDLIFYRLYLNS